MNVPPSYLSKVLQALVRAGIVQSTRGLRTAASSWSAIPDDWRMLDILNAVSPLKRIESCPLDLESHSSDLCPLHRRLDNALGMVEEAFAVDDPGRSPLRGKPLPDAAAATGLAGTDRSRTAI